MSQSITTREAAQRLGVSRKTVVRWIADGEFPNAVQLRPGPTSPWRIPLGDVEAFEERRLRERSFT